jgi:hypothetical protein
MCSYYFFWKPSANSPQRLSPLKVSLCSYFCVVYSGKGGLYRQATAQGSRPRSTCSPPLFSCLARAALCWLRLFAVTPFHPPPHPPICCSNRGKTFSFAFRKLINKKMGTQIYFLLCTCSKETGTTSKGILKSAWLFTTQCYVSAKLNEILTLFWLQT